MAQTDTQTPDNQLYLDDLVVGQRFTSRTHVVDATEIKAFARQFDPQPFHLDEKTAKHAFFGELVASGWHTAAITMRLLVETGLPLVGGIIAAGGEVSWPKPTRPGDTLAVKRDRGDNALSFAPRSGNVKGAQRNPKSARRNRSSPSRQADCAASSCKAVVARG
jgi:acyl dehydratase